MKKMFAILATLCLICASCAALADTEIPVFENMPLVVVEDEDTKVEETAFEGEWVLQYAFADTVYADNEVLFSTFDYDFVPYVIAEGKITKYVQKESEEFVTVEMPYTFEAGQLVGQDENGRDFVVELLEDGNIVMSVFYPGEGDALVCLSLYLVHPEITE